MKIKKIIDICKQTKRLQLMGGEDAEQWVSDGVAAYCLRGLPCFNEATICSTYDIPSKQAEKMDIGYTSELVGSFNYMDVLPAEIPCTQDPLGVVFSALDIVPYYTENGVLFLRKEYLAPFEGEQLDVSLYIRHTAAGQAYFAVKQGFYLQAVIMPYTGGITDMMTETLQHLCDLCKKAVAQEKQATQERERQHGMDA